MAILVGTQARNAPAIILDFITVLDDVLEGVEVHVEHSDWLERWEVTIRGNGVAAFMVQDGLVELVEKSYGRPVSGREGEEG